MTADTATTDTAKSADDSFKRAKKPWKEQRRKVKHRPNVNMTDEENDSVLAAMEAKGHTSYSSYFMSLHGSKPKTKPKVYKLPPNVLHTLKQALYHMNKTGNNLNQIAHVINCDEPPNQGALDEACRDMVATLSLVRMALGVKDYSEQAERIVIVVEPDSPLAAHAEPRGE